jgi:hypothetical protein
MATKNDRKKRRQQEAIKQGIGTPTLERLAKAGEGNVRVDGGRRYRIDSELRRLYNRKVLGGNDKVRNRLLLEAGERLQMHHELSGGRPARIRMDGSGGGGGDPARVMPQMAAAHHSKCLREAMATLYPDFAVAVKGIVLDNKRPEKVAPSISGRKQPKSAQAVVFYCLCAGLKTLAVHFKMAGPQLLEEVYSAIPADQPTGNKQCA